MASSHELDYDKPVNCIRTLAIRQRYIQAWGEDIIQSYGVNRWDLNMLTVLEYRIPPAPWTITVDRINGILVEHIAKLRMLPAGANIFRDYTLWSIVAPYYHEIFVVRQLEYEAIGAQLDREYSDEDCGRMSLMKDNHGMVYHPGRAANPVSASTTTPDSRPEDNSASSSRSTPPPASSRTPRLSTNRPNVGPSIPLAKFDHPAEDLVAVATNSFSGLNCADRSSPAPEVSNFTPINGRRSRDKRR